LTFSADRLGCKTEEGIEINRPYETYPRIVIGNDYIMFFQDMVMPQIVPLSVFQSKEDEVALRQLLELLPNAE
jgi:hypothetical protein